MADLSDLEQQFFATGQLPPELAQAAETPPAEKPILAPAQKVAEQQHTPTQLDTDAADALRRTLTDEQTRRIQAETRLFDMEKQLQEKLHPTVPPPDPNSDPLGSMMHQLQQVNGNVANLQQQLTQEQQNNLMKQQVEQFTNSIRQIKDEYIKAVPDFLDAYNHVRAIRTEDLRAVGVPEDRIPQVLLQDEFNITQQAIQRGKNPAAELYNMGKRYGYQPKAAPTTPEQKIANAQRGSAAAIQPERVASESLLTIEGLKDAGNDDLNKIVRDDKLWAKLVGGTSNDIF